jgi:hypothetical protein
LALSLLKKDSQIYLVVSVQKGIVVLTTIIRICGVIVQTSFWVVGILKLPRGNIVPFCHGWVTATASKLITISQVKFNLQSKLTSY